MNRSAVKYHLVQCERSSQTRPPPARRLRRTLRFLRQNRPLVPAPRSARSPPFCTLRITQRRRSASPSRLLFLRFAFRPRHPARHPQHRRSIGTNPAPLRCHHLHPRRAAPPLARSRHPFHLDPALRPRPRLPLHRAYSQSHLGPLRRVPPAYSRRTRPLPIAAPKTPCGSVAP